MRTFFILFIKELRSFLLSPLAYVLIALFTLLNGWFFVGIVKAMQLQVSSQSLIHNLFGSGWFWMGYSILFPLITMRVFAEERKMGTIEGLLTAPVRTAEVVLAKYFATVVVYMIIVAPVFLFFPLFQLITGEQGAYSSGAFWGSMLGIFLIGIFNVAIGTLASALTANQLIAAMLTFVLVLLHYFMGFLQNFGNSPDSIWADALTYISSTEHMNSLSEGLIDSRPIVYYISFSVVLIALTHHVLESRKWRV